MRVPDDHARTDLGAVPEGPGWLPAAIAAFEERVRDPAYPCTFGVRATRAGHNSYAALDRSLPHTHGVPGLVRSLLRFRRLAWTGPPRQSLVVFDGPPPAGADPPLAAHRARFWLLLRGLSGLDPAPWPAPSPSDPADPRWQWCFAGEPWFVFALSPAYRARRSRAVTACLTLVFQTQRVFTGLSGATSAGQAAKRAIRKKLYDYDLIGPHAHLGDAAGSSTYKWRQYVLPDDASVSPPEACPFHGAPGGSRPIAPRSQGAPG